jgi:hypothetical protein
MPTIPLQVFITPFAEQGKIEPTAWSCDDATSALNVANGIWQVAKIQFVIQNCTIDKPLDMAKSMRSSDDRVLASLSYRRKAGDGVNIFLLNRVSSLHAGGGSYVDCDPQAVSFVQMYDQMNNTGRALAHELGHLLSLPHLIVDYQNPQGQRNNLMVDGMITGGNLTTPQINSAKTSKLAKKFA